jgi:hypothetical protein
MLQIPLVFPLAAVDLVIALHSLLITPPRLMSDRAARQLCRDKVRRRAQIRAEEEEARCCYAQAREAERIDKLQERYLMLYLILTPEEVRIAMSEPTGWRPPIPLGEELQI